MKELFQTILTAMQEQKELVMVSIIKTEGSTPRGPGAHMLAGADGRIWGTVGGGLLEGQALVRCRQVLDEKKGCREVLVLRDDVAGGLEATCGGTALLLFGYIHWSDREVKGAALLALELLSSCIRCRLILCAGENWGMTVRGGGMQEGSCIPGELWQELSEQPVLTGEADEALFIQPLLREERVILFGGGHVAQALVPVLVNVGFRCIVVEDRPEYCTPELFPGAEDTCLLEMDHWVDALRVTERDLLCVMTRGHRHDTDCLCQALRTPARYIGLMGSRRKIACTNDVLRQLGFSEEELSRIMTPIGLDIGAETPAEIAVSIAAQLIAVRAGK